MAANNTNKTNVLVYSGPGTTSESVRHVLYSLRRLLSPYYSITPITADTILKEPWQPSCALLVIPGGADLPYCRAFDGNGNRKITQYVRRGGSFLGFCAGGYYGSARCEFEPDDKLMAVVGPRELKFFEGTCRGGAFKGFAYASEAGARAVRVGVEVGGFEGEGKEEVPGDFISYYNGGGVFVDADQLAKRNQGSKVTVLARYLDPLDIQDVGNAAIVHMKVAEGNVILTGPHPEFAGCNLDRNMGGREYGELVDRVTDDHEKQTGFLKGMLRKLGLRVSQEAYMIPKLTVLHLTSVYPEDVGSLLANLRAAGLVTKEGDKEMIFAENDTFIANKQNDPESDPENDKIIDYHKVIKTIQLHPTFQPSKSLTPYFNHSHYYKSLTTYRSQSRLSPSQFGSFLLYGEVVSSTSTMLDKNYTLLEKLPNGLTSIATMQISARGRGSNVWISPLGGLVFSTILKHPMELSVQAPVVFIQYLTAMAIVEGIKTYAPGYQDIPVKLKWPNDIYAEDPSPPSAEYNPKKGPRFVKIGGILLTSTFTNNMFHLVIGCGINTTNSLPTTSLNHLLSKLNSQRRITQPSAAPLPSYQLERLLARILVVLEEFYYRFALLGFRPFEETYYKHWMHSDQLVRLEMEGGARARVKGITMDHGLLKAEEITGEGEDERKTGRVFTLQSDGNSFDFFNGLLKVKT
ncbi:class II aaRS and biotin synthetase [Terfezia boudieri ATCC MYA-4762]|uniref:Class II aaRS and biotin synthetase n=1 Tax=Terfezia boudieri ATCC MYA-4762 TaxID=1051890 RepID=A0A3N4LJ79_9PEZI|nr:class II aaRS and biotin synthetase [Terfezia boudieri ATCC MYA-4762]